MNPRPFADRPEPAMAVACAGEDSGHAGAVAERTDWVAEPAAADFEERDLAILHDGVERTLLMQVQGAGAGKPTQPGGQPHLCRRIQTAGLSGEEVEVVGAAVLERPREGGASSEAEPCKIRLAGQHRTHGRSRTAHGRPVEGRQRVGQEWGRFRRARAPEGARWRGCVAAGRGAPPTDGRPGS